MASWNFCHPPLKKNRKSHVTHDCAYRNSRQWRLKVAIALRIAKTRSIGWLLGTFEGTISDLKSNWRLSNFIPQSFRISRKFDHHLIMLNLSMKTKAWTTQFAWAVVYILETSGDFPFTVSPTPKLKSRLNSRARRRFRYHSQWFSSDYSNIETWMKFIQVENPEIPGIQPSEG